MGKKQILSRRKVFRIDEQTDRKLGVRARREQVDESQILRRALRRYLEEAA